MKEVQYISGDFLAPRDAWDTLSLEEQAEMIKAAVSEGIFDLKEIRHKYNQFAEGGPKRQAAQARPAKHNRFEDMSIEELEAPARAVDKYWEQQQKELESRTPEQIRQMGIDADRRYRQEHPEGGEADPTLQRAADLIVSAMQQQAPITGEGIRQAAEEQRQEKLDKWHDYKKGIESTLTAAELLAAGYGVSRGLLHLGKYSADRTGRTVLSNTLGNWVDKWDKPQVIMNTLGTGADVGQLVTGTNPFDTWENAIEAGAGTAGIIGGTNWFRGRPFFGRYGNTIDDILDVAGYGAASWDIVKNLPPLSGTLDGIREQTERKALGGPLVDYLLNEYAKGGGIHIKPSHRGRLTELKKRTGKSEAELYRTGSPATRKMITFARNARKWKHSLGGNLFDGTTEDSQQMQIGLNVTNGWKPYTLGDILANAARIEQQKQAMEDRFNNDKQTITYRNRPATRTLVKTKDGSIVMTLPARQRDNNSQTQERSQKMEGQMNIETYRHQQKSGGSNPAFDIPFIPEKAIILNGSTTSTNVLDSLAKYAGIHNRDPRLSEHPIMHSSKYKAPRTINKNEMLGLAAQETKNGAMPYFNFTDGDAEYNRALANSNYFTSYGFIPADNIVRNFHYNDADVDRNTPPLLDAFRYFAQGDYNRGDKSHTSDVNATGAKLWNDPKVKEWWEKSGKYWYNYGHGPQKEENKEQKKQSLQLRYYEKNEPRIVP